MDPKHLERLRVEQQNYQFVCQDKLAKWEKFKQDYLSLKSRLETLPHELKYDIMVPICKNAFMPGRLVNTNEIMVLLGENWFAERSAKQACEMIDRRLESINKHIDEVNSEVKLYQEQMKWTDNLMKERGEFVNIEEKIEESEAPKQQQTRSRLNDQEIKELRRKQQERALRAQEAVNKELKKVEEKPLAKKEENTSTEAPVENSNSAFKPSSLMEQIAEQFKVMDIEETTNERMFDQELDHMKESDLKSMMSEYDKQVDRENNKMMAKILNENVKSIEKKHVKWSDSESMTKSDEINDEDDDDDYDDEYDDDEEVDDYIESDQEAAQEPVKQASKTSVIKIKHTSNEALDEIDRRNRLSRDKPELSSPGDIYNMFYKPKSILKQSSKENIPVAVEDLEPKKPLNKESPKNAENEKFEPEKAFSGEIVERKVLNSKADLANAEVDSSSQTAKKPVSRFKASKK